jgi:peptide deformylase
MILKIRPAGDSSLRKNAKELLAKDIRDKQTQALIDHMIETLRDAQGVGLAAPQVGENTQIIIIEDKAKYHKKISKKLLAEQERKPFKLKILINPTIEERSDEEKNYFEGCLSVDGYRAVVPRSKQIKVRAMDRLGKEVKINARGWFARVLQHEIDHLNGVCP